MLRTLAILAAASCLTLGAAVALAGSPNGRAGSMDAYYDGQIFTMNFMELSDDAAASILAKNQSVNELYVSDTPLPDGSMFIAVLDAIQGDGFNPLWQEVQIEFAPGVTPYQLTSDTAIDEAIDMGLISEHPTDEVYRCSVIGKKSGSDESGALAPRPGLSPLADPSPTTGAVTWSRVKVLVGSR